MHDNVQTSVRYNQATAEWLEGLTIAHHPPKRRIKAKHEYYEMRLRKAIEKEPGWYRYYWFLGYRLYCDGRLDEAVENLEFCRRSNSSQFPVEVLNSTMVLATVYQQSQKLVEAKSAIASGLEFLEGVRDDFEVAINFRIRDWLVQANKQLDEGRSLKSYSFAY